jgi:hypothetical protein
MVAACSGSLMMSMTNIFVRLYQVDRLRSMALVSNLLFLPLVRGPRQRSLRLAIL